MQELPKRVLVRAAGFHDLERRERRPRRVNRTDSSTVARETHPLISPRIACLHRFLPAFPFFLVGRFLVAFFSGLGLCLLVEELLLKLQGGR